MFDFVKNTQVGEAALHDGRRGITLHLSQKLFRTHSQVPDQKFLNINGFFLSPPRRDKMYKNLSSSTFDDLVVFFPDWATHPIGGQFFQTSIVADQHEIIVHPA